MALLNKEAVVDPEGDDALPDKLQHDRLGHIAVIAHGAKAAIGEECIGYPVVLVFNGLKHPLDGPSLELEIWGQLPVLHELRHLRVDGFGQPSTAGVHRSVEYDFKELALLGGS
jgi:hypothetical protein